MTGKSYVGGLVGELVGESYEPAAGMMSIINSYTTCSVTGEIYAGGLVGSNGAPIFESFAKGNVANTKDDEKTYSYFRGVVGMNSGTIYNSYTWGEIDADMHVQCH